MANYVRKIRTESGDLQIDYNALANLPQSDTTLTKSGEFADAKVTGDAVSQLGQDIRSTSEELHAEITELDAEVIKSINNITPNDDGSISLTPESIGAVSASDPVVGTIGGLTGEISIEGGLAVSGNSIVNSGVRAIETGGSNGTINVNTGGSVTDVAVKGLGSAAYTESEVYITKAMLSLSDKTLYITTT